jgi:hypothetical protein
MASEMILAKLSQLQGFGEKFIAKMGEKRWAMHLTKSLTRLAAP